MIRSMLDGMVWISAGFVTLIVFAVVVYVLAFIISCAFYSGKYHSMSNKLQELKRKKENHRG